MSFSYPIHERFATFQGEGVYMGRPAFFIRTYGCPVHCPWCDSAGTWHKDWVPAHIPRMTVEQLVTEAVESGMGRVVVTGGEPTVFNLNPLTNGLDDVFVPIHLETSGAFPIVGNFDWVTLSPKRWKPPLADSVAEADEFKIIVETPEDISFYLDMLDRLMPETNTAQPCPTWLHPEWTHREDPTVLGAIAEAVKGQERGQDLRAGWQLHKLYRVDMRDTRLQPMVPLGGDLRKGY